MKLKGFISTRVTAILIVVVLSGVSFTLGFLVGKTTLEDKSQTLEIASKKVEVAPSSAEGLKEAEVKAPARQETQVSNTAHAEKQASAPAKELKNVYSVQVEAFKDKKDAEALKKLLIEKGYKPYLISAQGLHKVRVGRFADKKSAEVSALKIKKGGFSPFVVEE